MSRLRTADANLKESSSPATSILTIEIALPGQTFKASGETHEVTRLFEKFLKLIDANDASQTRIAETKPITENPMRPVLQKLFEHDHQSPLIVFRSPPSQDEPLPNWILILLLGYKELRNIRDVTATAVIHALRHSSYRVPRLDRLLQPYLKQKYLVKGGRGKGGFYRLTSYGIEKAYERVKELDAFL